MKKKLFLALTLYVSLFASCQDKETDTNPNQVVAQQQPDKLDLAGAEFHQGNYSKAIQILDEIIKENNPNSIYQANYNKAYCYYKIDDFITVKDILDFVLKIDNNDPNYNWFRYNSFFMLGRVASKEDSVEKAFNYFYKAIEYNKTADIYNTLAFYEARHGKYKSALEHINLAISYKQNVTDHYATRALIYLKLNKIDSAIADVEKSILIDSLNSYAFKHRAMINIKLNKLKEACDDLHRSDALQYKKYSNVQDVNDVDSLINKYCKNTETKNGY